MKTIPPYKPVTHEVGSSDPSSSPEKETDSVPSSFQRKTGNDKLASASTTTTPSTSGASKQQFGTQSSTNSGGSGNSATSNSNPNLSTGNFTNDNPVSNSMDATPQSTTTSVESKSQQQQPQPQQSTKYKQHSKIVESHTSKENSKDSRDKQHSKIVKSHSSKDNSNSSMPMAAGDFDPANAHSNGKPIDTGDLLSTDAASNSITFAHIDFRCDDVAHRVKRNECIGQR